MTDRKSREELAYRYNPADEGKAKADAKAFDRFMLIMSVLAVVGIVGLIGQAWLWGP